MIAYLIILMRSHVDKVIYLKKCMCEDCGFNAGVHFCYTRFSGALLVDNGPTGLRLLHQQSQLFLPHRRFNVRQYFHGHL